jgi:hypothetical protein
MSRGGVPGFMASHPEKTDIHLKGGISQEPEELNFRVHRRRHKVNNSNLKGAYILMFRPGFGYNEYIFFPEGVISRQGYGYFDRHIRYIL